MREEIAEDKRSGRRTLAVRSVGADEEVALGSGAVCEMDGYTLVVMVELFGMFVPLNGDVGHEPLAEAASLGPDEWAIGTILDVCQ